MRQARTPLKLLAATLTLAVTGSLVAITSPTSAADDGTHHIVGGTTTSTSKYPWQARLEISSNQGTALCGGVIIHSRIVLTAAHCLVGATSAVAYFGRDQASSGGVAAEAIGSFITSDYNPAALNNDYGMLFFGSPIPSVFTPIKIAGPGEAAMWRAGRTATAVGFGNVVEGGSSSPTLQEVKLPIQPDSTCSADSAYGLDFRSASMLCVGSLAGGKSTCQGDSGGPLIVPGDRGVWRIAGLVSWAEGCARPGKPTVFTRIANPEMNSRLLSEINQVKAANPTLFPGTESAIDIIGSGAVPRGCTAANATAKKAASKATTAKKKSTKASSKAKAANKKVAEAKRSGASASTVAKLQKAAKVAGAKAKSARAEFIKAQRASSKAASAATARCT